MVISFYGLEKELGFVNIFVRKYSGLLRFFQKKTCFQCNFSSVAELRYMKIRAFRYLKKRQWRNFI